MFSKINLRTLGIAVVLAAIMFVIVARFDTSGGEDATIPVGSAPAVVEIGGSPSGQPSGPPASGAASPENHDDHDDGTDDGSSLIVKPTSAPDAQEAATAFAAAWLNTAGRTAEIWRKGIADRVTEDLNAQLAQADPDSVPAAAKTGQATVTTTGSLVTAQAPIVTYEVKPKPVGTLTLTMVKQGNRWLVSEIDWEREQ